MEKEKECALALNKVMELLDLDSEDKEAAVEVVLDFFTSPGYNSNSDGSDVEPEERGDRTTKFSVS